MNITVPVTMLDKVVDFVTISSLAAKKAGDELDVHRTNQEKAAEARKSVLAFLLENKVIKQAEADGVAAMMGDHLGTLHMLKAATERVLEYHHELRKVTKQAHENGTAVSDEEAGVAGAGSGSIDWEKASQASLSGSRIGGHTQEIRASDRPLMRLIGKG